MDKNRNNTNKPLEQDELLREGRRDDERVSPFEQASQKLDDNKAMTEDAEAEQQHKEAMTERD
jgi:hypothetical protein